MRTEADWLRPGPADPPRWGHRDGLTVGLSPLPGPRGLLRVYTPYLGHRPERMVNYVAVEPVTRRGLRRGFSELERSRLDDEPGLTMWTGDGRLPDPGRLAVVDGVEVLTVLVRCERFASGAEVDLRVRFRADRPHEVELAAAATATSRPLRSCVLTATMGNYARLRTLRLAGREVHARQLWPWHRGDRFTLRASFGLGALPREPDGTAVVAARGDEDDPAGADYEPSVLPHWHWQGERAEQAWVVPDPHPRLRAQVNGRVTYWASSAPIPGGVAFENLEVREPYRPWRPLVFRVTPLPGTSDSG
ncbi:hypothetical protein DT076_15415 [Desertihabitans brevis]|uniref:Uncharacterized protein n=1 Tax=Desertihabitans brevis TaxID=2268447 RepID=A0A367YRV1_9ACTN|nr:hypothetical protein [Desertihabitans brevis]RCK68613.1 hypothetical protein DT076_15415 [Desertihabitans brevis]